MTWQRLEAGGVPMLEQGFTVEMHHGMVDSDKWLQLLDPEATPWTSRDCIVWVQCIQDDGAFSPCEFPERLLSGDGEAVIQIRYRSDAAGVSLLNERVGSDAMANARRARIRGGGGVPVRLDVGPDVGLQVGFTDDELEQHIRNTYLEELL